MTLISDFQVSDEDVEYLTGLLLEREIPLRLDELALALLERREQEAAEALAKRFEDVVPYNPSKEYNVGQRVVFPQFNYDVGTVTAVAPGRNAEYGAYTVIDVAFDGSDSPRRFAAALTMPHKLSDTDANGGMLFNSGAHETPEATLAAERETILPALRQALAGSDELVSLAGRWFPRSLMIDVNEGHLNLAEAVLDISGGGPMTTEQILTEIGGVGGTAVELEAFSMNYVLNADPRFDEVGPVDTVLWFLRREEPQEVLQTPPMLQYTPTPYDEDALTNDMLALEEEIDDEWSEIDDSAGGRVTLTLIYPHQRSGTLPLNAKMRAIFPTARVTPRVWVTLVDGQDGEEFNGWVVRQDRYVYGLANYYRKHKLPVGAYVTVQHAAEPGKVIVDYRAHRPRTEYVRMITPKNNQLTFEEQKRSIGAEYDDLMILGTDMTAELDALFQQVQQSRRPLAAILRGVIGELSRMTPQGTVHAKTIYSAVNVLRRCPPGPILATLNTNPDFENVGSHYWRLSET